MKIIRHIKRDKEKEFRDHRTIRKNQHTGLAGFFFMLGRSKTDVLFYASRKNTRGASCFWNPVYTSRALDCMHAAYVFATYSQPTGKYSWLAQGVSVGAFAAAASLLFGVLKHDTLFLSASADRFLYRRCNLWIKDTAATNYISINARMGHIVHTSAPIYVYPSFARTTKFTGRFLPLKRYYCA